MICLKGKNMDFDAGFHEEMYEEGYEDGCDETEAALGEEYDPEPDEDSESNGLGTLIGYATAAGLGYQMAKDEIDERKLAENILKNRTLKVAEPIKIPLSARHKTKGHKTPFARWSTRANIDPKTKDEELEYTMEEQLQIIRAEGEGHE
jgi:hypothetical protein